MRRQFGRSRLGSAQAEQKSSPHWSIEHSSYSAVYAGKMQSHEQTLHEYAEVSK